MGRTLRPMADFSFILLNADELSPIVYDYYVNLLKTDRLAGEEIGLWNEIDENYQSAFKEAIDSQIIVHLKRYVEQKGKEAKVGNFPCYVCDRVPVVKPGGFCAQCAYDQAPRQT